MMGAFFQECHQMLCSKPLARCCLMLLFGNSETWGKILEKVRHCVSFQFEQGPKLEPVGKNESSEHKADQGCSPRNRDTELSQQPRKTRKHPAITK